MISEFIMMIIYLAIVATLVRPNSPVASIVTGITDALSTLITAAVNPPV